MSQERLDEIATRVDRGETPTVTVRRLLAWFGAERRGSNVVSEIRRKLRSRKLKTTPDFAEVWIDAEVTIGPVSTRPSTPKVETREQSSVSSSASTTDPNLGRLKDVDAVHRIALLDSANRGVTSVPPGSTVSVAVTKMLIHDFSQLPIMQNPRSCKGAVTWQAIAKQLALGNELARVEDCMEPVDILDADKSLLDAIPHVIAAGFVLVKAADKTITGIITTADLSMQFHALSEPFILLGQVENLLRSQIQRSFTLDELRAARDPADTKRTIEDASNLTFGEYVRLLEQPEKWKKLEVSVDHGEFLESLRRVHAIRNDVMHFHPDPLEREELASLRNFARFLELIAVG